MKSVDHDMQNNIQVHEQARAVAVERTADAVRDVISAVNRGGGGHLIAGSVGADALLSLAGDLYVGHLVVAHAEISKPADLRQGRRLPPMSRPAWPDVTGTAKRTGGNVMIAVIKSEDAPFLSPPVDDTSADSTVDPACSCHPDSKD